MAEYHLTLTEAVFEFPLAAANVLLPVRNERQGGNSGPGFVTSASIRGRNTAKAWLEQHYQIVDKPVAEVGWKLG